MPSSQTDKNQPKICLTWELGRINNSCTELENATQQRLSSSGRTAKAKAIKKQVIGKRKVISGKRREGDLVYLTSGVFQILSLCLTSLFWIEETMLKMLKMLGKQCF